jgi:hypothetical protein
MLNAPHCARWQNNGKNENNSLDLCGSQLYVRALRPSCTPSYRLCGSEATTILRDYRA